MTNFRNVLLLSLGPTLGGNAIAQNEITFGIEPGQATTGSSSTGGAGSLGVTVGGFGTIPVNVPPGTDSAGIASATAAALTRAGFTVNQNGLDVTVTAGPGGAPLQFGGGIVESLEWDMFGSAWDLFGTAEARIGMGGTLDAFVLPNQFSLWIIGNGPGVPGLMEPLVPLPFIGPDSYSPFDPLGALTLGGASDPLGMMHLPLPIPLDVQLVGLELFTQALALDPFAPSLFDSSRRTNALTLRIDD